MINRRAFTASLLAAVPATGFLGKSVLAQTMRDITFVQPSPSAINSFPVFVAIGKGFGELIRVAASQLNTPRVFSLILYLSHIGLALYVIVQWTQRKVVFWQQETVGSHNA